MVTSHERLVPTGRRLALLVSFALMVPLFANPAAAEFPTPDVESSLSTSTIRWQTRLEQKIDANDLPGLLAELRTWLQTEARRTSGPLDQTLTALVGQPTYCLRLAQHEVLASAGVDELKAIAAEPEGKLFLKRFLGDREWIEAAFCSGPCDGDAVVRNLYLIFKHDRRCIEPLYKKLATALALRGASPYRLVRGFQLYVEHHRQLLLHASFDDLEVWEMRLAVDAGRSDTDLEFLVHDRHDTKTGYGKACWSCAYRLHNVFGDSIHGRDYYRPWDHAYSWAERSRYVGGVCGTLSTYGARSTKAHGIPAMTAGQPGHCAYAIRLERGDWKTYYNVGWPSTPKESFWRRGAFTYLFLAEDVYAEPEKVLRARRHAWQARLYRQTARVEFESGIRWRTYQGNWKKLPDFNKLSPVAEGTASDFDWESISPSRENWGAVFEGTLQVERTGRYGFTLRSDDGSRLSIDSKVVLNNDGTHAMNPKTAAVELTKGKHPFRLEFFQGSGAQGLEIEGPTLLESPETETAYRLATAAHPIHPEIWEQRVAWMTQNPPEDLAVWARFFAEVAEGLVQHQEAAWAIIHSASTVAVGDQEPRIKFSLLQAMHNRLREDRAEHFVKYPFDRSVLNRQITMFGKDRDAQFAWFAAVLEIHRNDPTYFAQLFDWGRIRFGEKPDTATRFAQTIAKVLSDKSTGSDDDPKNAKPDPKVRTYLADALLAAAQADDRFAWQGLAETADQLLELDQPGEFSLNAAQARAFPKFKPFGAAVLSADGLLKLSSTYKSDKPLSHRAVLRPGGGFFCTDRQDRPSAEVHLPGTARLHGIVLVNRYERPDYMTRQVPLTVSISTDGKSWQKVFAASEPEPVWRIDLTKGIKEVKQTKDIKGSPKIEARPQARFVRVEVDHGEQVNHFHLRNILVYGEKLY